MSHKPANKLLLEADQLAYQTPSGRALAAGLSFQLHAGETLLIEGPNGAGKSTLLRILLGQLAPVQGSVTRHVRDSDIAYIPQLQNTEFHLPLSLGDLLALRRTHSTNTLSQWGLLSPAHLGHAWNTASGGERKRALLLRALLQNCSLLILDEPFNHLDKESKVCIESALSQFLAEPNQTRAIVLVSHQAPAALSTVQRITVGRQT